MESLGHMNYLHSALSQPLGSWEGFYVPQSSSMNFALRYQLAFATYAVAALSQQTPAYRAPYAEAMRGAIEKMLDGAAWNYWRAGSPVGDGGNIANAASSGHIAVLVSPHQRLPAGPPSDPVRQDNVQYSGHLSAMLGLYEKVTGDKRYDRPFDLQDWASGTAYSYTHQEVAERIYLQMRENRFGGVCCEQGLAYVPCNNYSLASNTLHDLLHGTDYSLANPGWLRTVRDKMVLKGPPVRGTFGVNYVKDLGVAAPVAFNFTDAWGLAFMLPFDRPLVRKLYRRFRKKVTQVGAQGAYVSSSPLSEKMEISDVPINTGFGLLLARGIGDERLADDMARYSSAVFHAGWQGTRYLYRGAPRTLHTTALYALASAIEPGGANFTRLFRSAPSARMDEEPYLHHLSDSSGRVGVSHAEYYTDEKALHIELQQVGDAAELKAQNSVSVTLTLGNIAAKAHVEVNGVPLHDLTPTDAGELSFDASVVPGKHTGCVVGF